MDRKIIKSTLKDPEIMEAVEEWLKNKKSASLKRSYNEAMEKTKSADDWLMARLLGIRLRHINAGLHLREEDENDMDEDNFLQGSCL